MGLKFKQDFILLASAAICFGQTCDSPMAVVTYGQVTPVFYDFQIDTKLELEPLNYFVEPPGCPITFTCSQTIPPTFSPGAKNLCTYQSATTTSSFNPATGVLTMESTDHQEWLRGQPNEYLIEIIGTVGTMSDSNVFTVKLRDPCEVPIAIAEPDPFDDTITVRLRATAKLVQLNENLISQDTDRYCGSFTVEFFDADTLAAIDPTIAEYSGTEMQFSVLEQTDPAQLGTYNVIYKVTLDQYSANVVWGNQFSVIVSPACASNLIIPTLTQSTVTYTITEPELNFAIGEFLVEPADCPMTVTPPTIEPEPPSISPILSLTQRELRLFQDDGLDGVGLYKVTISAVAGIEVKISQKIEFTVEILDPCIDATIFEIQPFTQTKPFKYYYTGKLLQYYLPQPEVYPTFCELEHSCKLVDYPTQGQGSFPEIRNFSEFKTPTLSFTFRAGHEDMDIIPPGSYVFEVVTQDVNAMSQVTSTFTLLLIDPCTEPSQIIVDWEPYADPSDYLHSETAEQFTLPLPIFSPSICTASFSCSMHPASPRTDLCDITEQGINGHFDSVSMTYTYQFSISEVLTVPEGRYKFIITATMAKAGLSFENSFTLEIGNYCLAEDVKVISRHTGNPERYIYGSGMMKYAVKPFETDPPGCILEYRCRLYRNSPRTDLCDIEQKPALASRFDTDTLELFFLAEDYEVTPPGDYFFSISGQIQGGGQITSQLFVLTIERPCLDVELKFAENSGFKDLVQFFFDGPKVIEYNPQLLASSGEPSGNICGDYLIKFSMSVDDSPLDPSLFDDGLERVTSESQATYFTVLEASDPALRDQEVSLTLTVSLADYPSVRSISKKFSVKYKIGDFCDVKLVYAGILTALDASCEKSDLDNGNRPVSSQFVNRPVQVPEWFSKLDDQTIISGDETFVYEMGKAENEYGEPMHVDVDFGSLSDVASYDAISNSISVDQTGLHKNATGYNLIKINASYSTTNEEIIQFNSRIYFIIVKPEQGKMITIVQQGEKEPAEKGQEDLLFGLETVKASQVDELVNTGGPIPFFKSFSWDGKLRIGWTQNLQTPQTLQELPQDKIAVQLEVYEEYSDLVDSQQRPNRRLDDDAIVLTDGLRFIIADAVEIKIMADDEDEDKIEIDADITWKILSFQSEELLLSLNWERNLGEEKKFVLIIWKTEYFIDDEYLHTPFGSKVKWNSYRQAEPAELDDAKSIQAAVEVFLWLIFVIFVLTICLAGSQLPFWMFFNSLQLLVHIVLIKTNIPAQANFVLNSLLDYTRLQYSMTNDILSAIFKTDRPETNIDEKYLFFACGYSLSLTQNLAPILALVAVGFAIWFMLCIYDLIRMRLKKNSRVYGTNMLVRILYEFYFEFTFCVILYQSLNSPDDENQTQDLVHVILLVVLLSSIAFVFLTCFKFGPYIRHSYQQKSLLQSYWAFRPLRNELVTALNFESQKIAAPKSSIPSCHPSFDLPAASADQNNKVTQEQLPESSNVVLDKQIPIDEIRPALESLFSSRQKSFSPNQQSFSNQAREMVSQHRNRTEARSKGNKENQQDKVPQSFLDISPGTTTALNPRFLRSSQRASNQSMFQFVPKDRMASRDAVLTPNNAQTLQKYQGQSCRQLGRKIYFGNLSLQMINTLESQDFSKRSKRNSHRSEISAQDIHLKKGHPSIQLLEGGEQTEEQVFQEGIPTALNSSSHKDQFAAAREITIIPARWRNNDRARQLESYKYGVSKNRKEQLIQEAKTRLSLEQKAVPSGRFQTLFTGLKRNNEHNVAVVYPLLFLLRRIAFSFSLIYLYEMPYFASQSLIALTIFVLGYVLLERPWCSSLIQLQHVCNEIGLYILLLIVSFLCTSGAQTTQASTFLCKAILYVFMVILVYNTAVISVDAASRIRHIAKRLLVIYRFKKQRSRHTKKQKNPAKVAPKTNFFEADKDVSSEDVSQPPRTQSKLLDHENDPVKITLEEPIPEQPGLYELMTQVESSKDLAKKPTFSEKNKLASALEEEISAIKIFSPRTNMIISNQVNQLRNDRNQENLFGRMPSHTESSMELSRPRSPQITFVNDLVNRTSCPATETTMHRNSSSYQSVNDISEIAQNKTEIFIQNESMTRQTSRIPLYERQAKLFQSRQNVGTTCQINILDDSLEDNAKEKQDSHTPISLRSYHSEFGIKMNGIGQKSPSSLGQMSNPETCDKKSIKATNAEGFATREEKSQAQKSAAVSILDQQDQSARVKNQQTELVNYVRQIMNTEQAGSSSCRQSIRSSLIDDRSSLIRASEGYLGSYSSLQFVRQTELNQKQSTIVTKRGDRMAGPIPQFDQNLGSRNSSYDCRHEIGSKSLDQSRNGSIFGGPSQFAPERIDECKEGYFTAENKKEGLTRGIDSMMFPNYKWQKPVHQKSTEDILSVPSKLCTGPKLVKQRNNISMTQVSYNNPTITKGQNDRNKNLQPKLNFASATFQKEQKDKTFWCQNR